MLSEKYSTFHTTLPLSILSLVVDLRVISIWCNLPLNQCGPHIVEILLFQIVPEQITF